jgi:hypothetical protein
MEAKCSSETSGDFERTTRRYILEERTLHKHRYGNHKSVNQKVRDDGMWMLLLTFFNIIWDSGLCFCLQTPIHLGPVDSGVMELGYLRSESTRRSTQGRRQSPISQC